jgi:hypothetical protein
MGLAVASRIYLLIQLVSQVLPPSSENACSDCGPPVFFYQRCSRNRRIHYLT